MIDIEFIHETSTWLMTFPTREAAALASLAIGGPEPVGRTLRLTDAQWLAWQQANRPNAVMCATCGTVFFVRECELHQNGDTMECEYCARPLEEAAPSPHLWVPNWVHEYDALRRVAAVAR